MKTKTKTTTTTKTSNLKEAGTVTIKKPLINFLINLLKSFARIFNKFTPILWFIELIYMIKSIIYSFFASFRIIRESFEYLNKLPVFQLMRNIIRILSIISLILNLVILSIFTNFTPLFYLTSIPGISQIGAFVYESSPEKAQGFILWISLKIKTFLLWIWSGIIDFIKTIIKTVLGELDNIPNESKPIIDPDKGKYEDIYNKDYMRKLKENLYEYKYYILSGFIIIGIGAIAYLYWDSISCSWRRRDGDGDEGEQFIPMPTNPEIHGPTSGSIPSPDSSSSGNSYDNYFGNPISDKIYRFKNKISNYIKGKAKNPNLIGEIPKGVYIENGIDMYNGLPLPRVETLENGTEYYYRLDKDRFINVISNTFTSNNEMEVINPFSGKGISRVPMSVGERIAFINTARENSIFVAPLNSYSRNPIFEGMSFDITKPNTSSLPVASTSKLPTLESAEHLTDVDLTPRPKIMELEPENMIDMVNPFK